MLDHSTVLLFTGHLLDSVDRDSQRFPHHMIDDAQSLINKSVDEIVKIQSVGIAVASLGAGGDMLFAKEMIRRKIPLYIFLPFEKEKFILESVNYLKDIPQENPIEWRKEFERILLQARGVTITKNNGNDNAYATCNTAMLQFAFEQAGSERNISALALVRPGEEKIEGGAAHFVEEIKLRQIPVQILWPGVNEIRLEDIHQLEQFIPVFKHLDSQASSSQSKWRKRLKLSLIILGTIAFFDAFVTVPDHFLFGNGQVVRMFALVVSAIGAFVTLQMQLSDKTSLSQWTRSRAKAEQIRSEIWFYIFNYWSENNRYGPYSEGELELYVKQIAPSDWKGPLLDLSKVIQLKEVVQALSIEKRIALYLSFRLDDQLIYFKKKNAYFSNRIRTFKTVTLLFLCVSISWGVFKMFAEFYPSLSFFMDMSPLGMMISFIALVSSYSEANNSKEMEYKYQQMGEGLEALRNRHSTIKEIIQLDEWVKECETFLRTQNNEWSLKRDVA
jgi:hypothetical protein